MRNRIVDLERFVDAIDESCNNRDLASFLDDTPESEGKQQVLCNLEQFQTVVQTLRQSLYALAPAQEEAEEFEYAGPA